MNKTDKDVRAVKFTEVAEGESVWKTEQKLNLELYQKFQNQKSESIETD